MIPGKPTDDRELKPSRQVRLAYVVSHPIQYQAPLLRRIAAEPDIDLTVFFCDDFSVRSYEDKGFGQTVQWDTPLLEGYRSVVLPRVRATNSPSATRPVSFGMLRHFLRGGFDAVWVHGYASINSLQAILAANAAGIPVLLRAEGWLADRPRSRSTLLIKKVFMGLVGRMVDATLSIGTRNRAYWRAYFGLRVPNFEMPYAVENPWFRQHAEAAATSREALRASLDLEPGRPVILFASKLQERKHCDHLLEAYLRLRPAEGVDPDPYLVIVGDGEMRASLEARVAAAGYGSVRFAGFRNQGEIPAFFDLCTVFVLPSRHEPWGLIVNEAMNAARPVIVSNDAGCAPDLVIPGRTGWVYPAGDIAALQTSLSDALRDPERTAQMGRQAQARISAWDYEADVRGLRRALAHTTHKIKP